MNACKKALVPALFWGLFVSIYSFSAVAGGKTPTSPFKPFKPMKVASNNTSHSYVGANIAAGIADANCGATACEPDGMAWKVYGGYPLNDQMIIEAGYDHLGEFSNGHQSVSVKGFSASVLFLAPVHDQVSLFGRAGYYKWESEISDGQQKITADDFDPVLGAGVDYQFNDNMRIRAELDNYRSIMTDSAGGSSDLNTLGLGLTFSSL